MRACKGNNRTKEKRKCSTNINTIAVSSILARKEDQIDIPNCINRKSSKNCKTILSDLPTETESEATNKPNYGSNSERDIVLLHDSETSSDAGEIALKTNAFQFLMDSRNKIIGQNCLGKTVKEEDDTFYKDKEKLSFRKSLFQNWADQKGAQKRKREEKEIEKCITSKLEKRAKRLKYMLKKSEKKKTSNEQQESAEENTNDIEKPILRLKKKVKRLDFSDSESSGDLYKNKQSAKMNSKPSVFAEVEEENAQDNVIPISHLTKTKESSQNCLLDFFGILNKEEKIEIFEEPAIGTQQKEIIKIKMFTPENMRNGSRALSLQKCQSRGKRNITQTEESVKMRKSKSKKHLSMSLNSNMESNLNDSSEDFYSEIKKKKRNVDKCSQKSVEEKIDQRNFENIKTELQSSYVNEASLSPGKNEVMDKSSQNLKKIGKSKIKNLEVVPDESSQDRKLIDDLRNDYLKITPRTKQMCRIKIKCNTESKIYSEEIENHREQYVNRDDLVHHERILRPKRNEKNYSEDIFAEELSLKRKTTKKKLISVNNDIIEKIELSSDSDYEECSKKKAMLPTKVAPVFLKAIVNSKLDRDTIEARKKFLLSGIPESLKKTIVKQKSTEEKEIDVFPTISHVQQKYSNTFWDLPKANLKFVNVVPLEIDKIKLNCEHLITRKEICKINISTEVKKIDKLKSVLNQIKADNPNYPVYKAFRHIYEKSGRHDKKEQPKLKRKFRKETKKIMENIEAPKLDHCLGEYKMWTEKYRPRSTEEIFGNHKGVTALKKWVQMWRNYSEEINAREKQKRENLNSESEFESTDCDSRDSTRLPGNTIILGGPCGSGKTSAVYAVANELGLNVLELNASSKRTGKILIQELQEATQSHQMRKTEANTLAGFTNSDKTTKNNTRKKKIDKAKRDSKVDQKKKMCILLVEDVDLVFEQDEGFLTSLFQLITSSKRPIILTTTDNSSVQVQKLISQHEYISFGPFSLNTVAVWLQVLCLVEGLVIDKNDIGNLLEYNKGDIRKTILEIQYWVQSGGQLEKHRVFPIKTSGNDRNISDVKAEDEELMFDLIEETSKNELFIHRQCLGSFEIFNENEFFNIPYGVNLGILWWNIPNILDVPNYCNKRLHREKPKDNPLTRKEESHFIKKLKLSSAVHFYDSLILTDVLFRTMKLSSTTCEPVIHSWSADLKDSLELTEREEGKSCYFDLVRDLTHTLVNGCIEDFKSIEDSSCCLNMALPDSTERRWRAKQHICDAFLKEPISLSNVLDRKSVALDYLPVLRDIVRSEEKRATLNTKRGNRFRHYLRNINIDFKANTCKMTCEILTLNEKEY